MNDDYLFDKGYNISYSLKTKEIADKCSIVGVKSAHFPSIVEGTFKDNLITDYDMYDGDILQNQIIKGGFTNEEDISYVILFKAELGDNSVASITNDFTNAVADI